jgi:DNA-binding transcriptional MerR regulator
MKYLTTLEVANQLKVSKQTLLNWLYAGKVHEPPRNRQGYRLWSEARVALVRRMIDDGRLHKRTVVHQQPSNRPDVLASFAREVRQFLADAEISTSAFLAELKRAKPAGGSKAARRARANRPRATHSQGTSGMKRRSTGRPSRK